MTTHYLIDVSWILYRGYYALSHLYQYPEIHFLSKKLESLLSNKSATIHLCLDGHYTKGKKLLGENYKAGRHQENSYNVYAGLSTFVNLLHNDRVKVYYNAELESDEIIFTLSKTLDGRKKILSGDKDIFQALDKDVVIDNGNNFAITEESYKLEYADKFFGITPIKLPLYRAIVGDASDTLKPPVSRFPHKLAAKLVNEFDYLGKLFTVEDLKSLSKDYSSSEKKWVDKLIDNYLALTLNFDVMKLNVVSIPLHESYNYTQVEFDDFLKNKVLKLNTL